MPEETNKGGGDNRGGGNQSSNQQKAPRAPRKSVFDITNILGALLWLLSAVITAIPLMLIFLRVPQQCLGPRGQFVSMQCAWQVTTSIEGLIVFGTSVILQLIFSAMVWRIKTPITLWLGRFNEWVLNFVGLYWLLCIQIGAAVPVYTEVSTFLRTFGIEALLWWLLLIVSSVGWPFLEKFLFTAPPIASPQGVQRR